jgi:hypothetical protein
MFRQLPIGQPQQGALLVRDPDFDNPDESLHAGCASSFCASAHFASHLCANGNPLSAPGSQPTTVAL